MHIFGRVRQALLLDNLFAYIYPTKQIERHTPNPIPRSAADPPAARAAYHRSILGARSRAAAEAGVSLPVALIAVRSGGVSQSLADSIEELGINSSELAANPPSLHRGTNEMTQPDDHHMEMEQVGHSGSLAAQLYRLNFLVHNHFQRRKLVVHNHLRVSLFWHTTI